MLYESTANSIEYLDGISVSFDKWRFNVRQSNTESLIRLNIETRGNRTLLNEKILELTNLIQKSYPEA